MQQDDRRQGSETIKRDEEQKCTRPDKLKEKNKRRGKQNRSNTEERRTTI